MSFADEVEAALKPPLRCKTCLVLMKLDAKDRAEVNTFILANDDKSRRISLALKARGLSVSDSSVRAHARERHEL